MAAGIGEKSRQARCPAFALCSCSVQGFSSEGVMSGSYGEVSNAKGLHSVRILDPSCAPNTVPGSVTM